MPKYIEELRISHIVNEVMTEYINSYKRNLNEGFHFTEEELEMLSKLKEEKPIDYTELLKRTDEHLTDEQRRYYSFNLPCFKINSFKEIDDIIVLIVPHSLSKEELGEITTNMGHRRYSKVRQEYSNNKDIKFIVLVFKQKKPKASI